jgi:radical SAM protein with 4Fe4S-binding SPASM domain
MVSYAAGKGIRVTTNTNMTLLNPAKADRLVTCGLDRLHVSLDGATAATYERIRVRARFDRVVRNLEMFLAARDRRACAKPDLHLVLVVMRQNLDELADLVRLAHGWRASQVFVQHLCHDFGESSLPVEYRPMRDFVESETLLEEDPARIEQSFQEARRVARELGVDLRLPRTRIKLHAPGTPGPQRCDWPWRGAYISYQGYAMPCCMVATPDRIHFGNVLEHGVEPVWNGAACQAFRRRLASDAPPEICRSCSVYRGTF